MTKLNANSEEVVDAERTITEEVVKVASEAVLHARSVISEVVIVTSLKKLLKLTVFLKQFLKLRVSTVKMRLKLNANSEEVVDAESVIFEAVLHAESVNSEDAVEAECQ